MEYISNCCGAMIISPDICSDCKEHCEPEPDLDEEIAKTYDDKENNNQESDTE